MKLKKNKNHPTRIAVLLAAYNGILWIEEQINSIFQQKDVDVDIYISVDLSIDGTYEWCKDLSKKNTHTKLLSYGDRFGGAAKNFFRLIQDVDFSDYDYVALADQDDIWLPSKLSHAVETIKTRKVCALSSDAVAFFQDNSKFLIKKSYSQKKFDYFFESGGPGCTYVLESRALQEFKDFLVLNLTLVNNIASHDWLIYAYFREHALGWYIDSKSLILYRRHVFNQIGPNIGFGAYRKRLSMIKSGWYRKEVESIRALIDPNNQSGLQLDRLSLIKNFWQLRRHPRDAVVLLMILLIGIYE